MLALLVDGAFLTGAVSVISLPLAYGLDPVVRRSGAQLLVSSAGGPTYQASELSEPVAMAAAIGLLVAATVVLGSSPGKRLLRLRERDASGSAASPGQLAIRGIAKWLPSLLGSLSNAIVIATTIWAPGFSAVAMWGIAVPLSVIAIVLMLAWLLVFNGDRRGLHDYVAGTIVLRRADLLAPGFPVTAKFSE